MVIKRKNKTKFDYRVRALGIISVAILVLTFTLISPASNKLDKANAKLAQENTVLLNQTEDLSKEYNRNYETVKNIVD